MTTRIAIDAMGGDYAPKEIVEGAVWAALEYNVAIELVGRQDEIERELERIKKEGVRDRRSLFFFPAKIKVDPSKLDIKITHAPEVIEMGEAPGQAIRKKKNSSIVLSVAAVAQGSSQAVVACGSTGAAMASSLFGLGRLPGIERPAICCTLPSRKKPFILIDAGANSTASPEMLCQFALMGQTFAKNVLNIENPRVGIINIGEEAGKGNELSQTAYTMLEADEKINFIGNIEGKEIFYGDCDVVVSDGFVGNVILKVIEGTSSMLFTMIKEEFKKDILAIIIGLLAKPIMKRLYKRINYEEYGGAMLLGVKGITVIAHGRSKAYAVKNAVRVAKEAIETKVNEKIAEICER